MKRFRLNRLNKIAAVVTLTLSFLFTSFPAKAVDCYTTTIRQGSTGACVRLAQERLNAYHCSAGPIDGQFGSQTAAATRKFQTVNGLYVDRVVGPAQTWPKLKASTSKHCATTTDNDAADRALCTNSIT